MVLQNESNPAFQQLKTAYNELIDRFQAKSSEQYRPKKMATMDENQWPFLAEPPCSPISWTDQFATGSSWSLAPKSPVRGCVKRLLTLPFVKKPFIKSQAPYVNKICNSYLEIYIYLKN